MEIEPRPEPERLLRRLQAEEERQRRTVLKVFFGFAPGVGKIYSMLESARRLRKEGIDVVMGWVETHGRSETAALLKGLEVLPARPCPYRGTTLPEFDLDLDRAIARRPAVLLLDELPHTNAPGSRHRKRWQDVIELLDKGIEVHTTLNVQHLKSLNDVVWQITTIRVRETVPDTILQRADGIEVVDLPLEDLLGRMREGKVYLPETARQAVENFFRPGNLLALRELALRRAAERIDTDVQAYREDLDIRTTWPTAEFILACVGPGPSSARIIRAAHRMAAGLRARWVAVFVDAPGAYPVSPQDHERLQGHLRLAESLGAEVVRLVGKGVAEELLRHSRDRNVTRIVIGKPTHSSWRDWIQGSLVGDLVRGSGEIEVHFIAGEPAGESLPEAPLPAGPAFDLVGFGLSALVVGGVTVLGCLAREFLAQPDIVTLFLLTIMVVAYRWGQSPSLLASVLSVGAYDFFFVPPFFTFSVEHSRHLLTFSVMLVVGGLISSLTTRLRREEKKPADGASDRLPGFSARPADGSFLERAQRLSRVSGLVERGKG